MEWKGRCEEHKICFNPQSTGGVCPLCGMKEENPMVYAMTLRRMEIGYLNDRKDTRNQKRKARSGDNIE